MVNRDEKNIHYNPPNDQIWNLPARIGYIETNEGVLQVRTNDFGEFIIDNNHNHIDVLLAPRMTPIPDNQEWEILDSSLNGYFYVCHYSSRLLLTCQGVGNMTLSEQGNLKIFCEDCMCATITRS